MEIKKGFFNNGEFSFWKFVVITSISAAFSVGVGITIFNSRLDALANENKKLEERTDFNLGKIEGVADDIYTIKVDVGVIKNDLDWIKKNLNK